MNLLSVYTKPITNTKPTKNVSLADVYTVITSDKYKAATEKLRSLSTKQERDSFKQKELDYATFSGTFTSRSDSALIERSGYFGVDIDHIGTEQNISDFKARIIKSHLPAMIFTSPSGDGLKIVYKIDTDKGTHKDFYLAIEEYFRYEFGVKIDAACKDVSRACFLCYDSKCFYTETPELLGYAFLGLYKTNVKETKTEFETGDRPGDAYNKSNDSVYEMKILLEGLGWKHLDGYKWRRPGKEEGISATLGKVAPNVFYVFTSSASPFEPQKAYTPFQVLALAKYNGDFKAAAQSLVKTTVKPNQKKEEPKPEPSELRKILDKARIDITKHIDKPPVILSIKEQSATSSIVKRVFTLGNFSCIIGKAKSKKTFLVSMLTSSLLNTQSIEKFKSDLPANKKSILYFDTEQGEYDSYNVIKRIQLLSGDTSNLYAFNLRPFSPIERCNLIEYAFEVMGDSIGFCVIDGIADLANGINDEDEATRVVTILLRLSKVHNCHITTVLHQNKNDNFATGHIGSAVMKKAEIVLSVTKSKDHPNASDISNEMSRGVDFEPFQMVIDDHGMPYITGIVKRKEQIMKPAFEPAVSGSFDEEPPFDVPF